MKNIGSFHCNMSIKQADCEQKHVHIYHKHPNMVHLIYNKGTKQAVLK